MRSFRTPTASVWCLVSWLALIWTLLAFDSQLAFANDGESCDREGMKEFRSTDGRWIARVYGKTCDLGIMTSAAVLVDLVQAGVPDSAVTVLSIDMPTSENLWPKVQWESPNRLVIQLPANANIALQMANFQNIAIQVRFCPEDSAERSRWLAYRAEYRKWIADMAAWTQTKRRDPDSAGPEPIVPKAPKGREPVSSCEP